METGRLLKKARATQGAYWRRGAYWIQGTNSNFYGNMCLVLGRKALIRMIRQRKYGEILEQVRSCTFELNLQSLVTRPSLLNNTAGCRNAKSLMMLTWPCKTLLSQELETRNLNSHSKLGMAYHIHDIVGAEIVKR